MSPPSAADARIGVIIATYNHARFLDAAIRSVLAQTLRPAEIIVVDDGSQDAPEEVVSHYPEVRLVQQSNKGLAAARNTGWRTASSPYLLFLDADDQLRRDALALNWGCLNRNREAAFCYGAYANADAGSGAVRKAAFRAVPQAAFGAFLRGNQVGMHAAALFRRECLASAGGYHEELKACEDYDLYLRLSMHHAVLCHDAVVADYWHHGSNMSLDPSLMLAAALDVLRSYRHEARARGLQDDYAAGIDDWKRFYVGKWAAGAREGGMDHMRLTQSIRMARRAPFHLLRKIASSMLRRARISSS